MKKIYLSKVIYWKHRHMMNQVSYERKWPWQTNGILSQHLPEDISHSRARIMQLIKRLAMGWTAEGLELKSQ
jgi:hypothetical protein